MHCILLIKSIIILQYFKISTTIQENQLSILNQTENKAAFIQKNYEMIKRLDEFKLRRKKTDLTVPYSNKKIPNLNNTIAGLDGVTANDMNGVAAIRHRDYAKQLRQEENNKEYLPEHEEMFKILTKQSQLLLKFIETVQFDNFLRKNRDFEDLLDELDKNNEKDVEPAETTKTTVEERTQTIKTIFDETKIRDTLKNDPYVKRIIKMANKNREDYIKAAKKYYNI